MVRGFFYAFTGCIFVGASGMTAMFVAGFKVNCTIVDFITCKNQGTATTYTVAGFSSTPLGAPIDMPGCPTLLKARILYYPTVLLSLQDCKIWLNQAVARPIPSF